MALSRDEFIDILTIVNYLAHSDGDMHPAEKKVLIATFKAGAVTPEEQGRMKGKSSLEEMLQEIQTDHAKQTLIDLLALVASSDWKFEEEERVVMVKVMKKLGMSPDEYRFFKDGQDLDVPAVRAAVMEILRDLKTQVTSG